MDTEPIDLHPRNALAETLKRFLLTYEQHQLVYGAGIGLLASTVIVKRKRFTMLLALLAAVFAIQAGRGLRSTGACAFWAICGGVCAFWCWGRYAKTRALHDALVAYAADESEAQPTAGTLADELRLGFNLQYDEHQALHAGDAELAATRIIGRCKANTRNSIKGAVLLSGFGLLWIIASVFSEASALWGVAVWIAITIVVTVGAIAIAVADRATVARVEKLLHKHQSNATPPENLSARRITDDLVWHSFARRNWGSQRDKW